MTTATREETARRLAVAEPVQWLNITLVVEPDAIGMSVIISYDLYTMVTVAKKIATGFGRPVSFRFNGRVVSVAPDSDLVDVIAFCTSLPADPPIQSWPNH